MEPMCPHIEYGSRDQVKPFLKRFGLSFHHQASCLKNIIVVKFLSLLEFHMLVIDIFLFQHDKKQRSCLFEVLRT